MLMPQNILKNLVPFVVKKTFLNFLYSISVFVGIVFNKSGYSFVTFLFNFSLIFFNSSHDKLMSCDEKKVSNLLSISLISLILFS